MKKALFSLALMLAAGWLAAQTYNVKGKDANNNEAASNINFTTGTSSQVIVGSTSTVGSDNATMFLPGNLKIRSVSSTEDAFLAPYTPAATNGFLFRVERYFEPNITPGFTPYTKPVFNINSYGIVGIGTTDYDQSGGDGSQFKLFVKGGIRTEKIKVDLKPSGVWYDHVFNKDYKLMSFSELEAYIAPISTCPMCPARPKSAPMA